MKVKKSLLMRILPIFWEFCAKKAILKRRCLCIFSGKRDYWPLFKEIPMPEEKSFIWIPFYEEMALKLNAYRENRSELVELVKGIREKYRSYLTNKLFSKINDIDPFTVMGLINRSGFQRRSEIASYFKDV